MTNPAVGPIVISLLGGLVTREDHPKRWNELVKYRSDVMAYLQVMGVELFLDDAEGHAFIRQRRSDDDDFPRLVRSHALSFMASLMLALLRKRMLEQDATGDTRLVLTRDQVSALVRPFFGQLDNEPKFFDQIDRSILRIKDMGFLRPLTGRRDEYEVRRVLAAFVDAQWLHNLQAGLDAYRRRALGTSEPTLP